MKMRTYQFNLIEIVLTVAVIAFGVVVILGMLPKGLRASRNAGMESYASEIIDQMASYLQREGAASIKGKAESDAEEKDLVSGLDSDSDEYITANYLGLLNGHDWSSEFNVSNFKRTNTVGVYKYDSEDEDECDIYAVVMGNRVAVDGEIRNQVDFTGMIRVWKRFRDYDVIRINHDSVGVAEADLPAGHDCLADSANCTDNYSIENVESGLGARICMELSYPLSLPYAERTKRYYVFEVDK